MAQEKSNKGNKPRGNLSPGTKVLSSHKPTQSRRIAGRSVFSRLSQNGVKFWESVEKDFVEMHVWLMALTTWLLWVGKIGESTWGIVVLSLAGIRKVGELALTYEQTHREL